MPGDGSRVCLGLGSNLGEKQRNLQCAVNAMGAFATLRAVSSLYRTAPVGYLQQDWFLNAAVMVETALAPVELLRALLEVEQRMGRVRDIRNGPRLIDLDILLWEGLQVDDEDLQVPHPRLVERHFVLAPLAEIVPEWIHPGTGRTIAAHLQALGVAEGVERLALGAWLEDQPAPRMAR
ncbi:MAG: 2-amino-4-hydroxy-6-hydroxymethyldihydropteridine diphosphokinase [Bryobacterales bacterium]|jgi:2-amino-4-hydroxy-6-hydroxymethyldihydropteridine diphosphokinase|nr:2-amino-4-hydroxy-6-hydroxymethyldihydropteridine diphosphokinase [Bryobacterales bacterium]